MGKTKANGKHATWLLTSSSEAAERTIAAGHHMSSAAHKHFRIALRGNRKAAEKAARRASLANEAESRAAAAIVAAETAMRTAQRGRASQEWALAQAATPKLSATAKHDAMKDENAAAAARRQAVFAEEARIAYLMRAIASKKAEISYANATISDSPVEEAEAAERSALKRQEHVDEGIVGDLGGGDSGGSGGLASKLVVVWLMLLMPMISCFALHFAYKGFTEEKTSEMSVLGSGDAVDRGEGAERGGLRQEGEEDSSLMSGGGYGSTSAGQGAGEEGITAIEGEGEVDEAV